MLARDCLNTLIILFEEAGLSYGHGTDNANDEAWWLMHHVLYGSDDFREIPEDLLIPAAKLEAIEQMAEQRISTRQPLAYLTGVGWFCGMPFDINSQVLVPRSPIAELIDQGFETLLEAPPARILDLCAGSGCIGIACAEVFPDATVVLSDISAEALDIANKNIARYGLQGRVEAVSSDLFAGIEGQFDLIVTNPPYVPRNEYETLPEEFHREPVLGLVTEDEGLEIPLRILREAGKYLTEHGMLVLEVGNTWETLDSARPDLPFLWLDFENGGHGVCTLPAKVLKGLA